MNRLSDIDDADDSDVDSDIDNSSEVSSKQNEFLTTRSMLKKFMQGHMVGIYEDSAGGHFILFSCEDSDEKDWYLHLPLKLIGVSNDPTICDEVRFVPEVALDIPNTSRIGKHGVQQNFNTLTEIYVVNESYFLDHTIIFQHGWEKLFYIRYTLDSTSTPDDLKFLSFTNEIPFDFPPISEAYAQFQIMSVSHEYSSGYRTRTFKDRMMFDCMGPILYLNKHYAFYQMREEVARGFRVTLELAAAEAAAGKMDDAGEYDIGFKLKATPEQVRWLFENRLLYASPLFDDDASYALPYGYRDAVTPDGRCTYPIAHGRYLEKRINDIAGLLPILGTFFSFAVFERTANVGGTEHSNDVKECVSLICSDPNLVLSYDIIGGMFSVAAPIHICPIDGNTGMPAATLPDPRRKLKETQIALIGKFMKIDCFQWNPRCRRPPQLLPHGERTVLVKHVELLDGVNSLLVANPTIVVWTITCRELWDGTFDKESEDISVIRMFCQAWDLDDVDLVGLRIVDRKRERLGCRNLSAYNALRSSRPLSKSGLDQERQVQSDEEIDV